MPPFGGIDSATLFNNRALLNINLKLSIGRNIALIKAYTLCTGSDLRIFGRQGGHGGHFNRGPDKEDTGAT